MHLYHRTTLSRSHCKIDIDLNPMNSSFVLKYSYSEIPRGNTFTRDKFSPWKAIACNGTYETKNDSGYYIFSINKITDRSSFSYMLSQGIPNVLADIILDYTEINIEDLVEELSFELYLLKSTENIRRTDDPDLENIICSGGSINDENNSFDGVIISDHGGHVTDIISKDPIICDLDKGIHLKKIKCGIR